MDITILVRSGENEPWRTPTVEPYRNEDHLRTLLQKTPELLPGVGDSRPVVLVHEFAVSFGYVDLIGVSPTGALTVVEVKLRQNADMRRTIVGQLFAYASALWGMSYAEFDDAWQAKAQPFNMSRETWELRKRPPLLDEMAAACDEHRLDWNRDTFPDAVEANLKEGRYTLVFGVDVITDELKKTVEYLSVHTADVNVIAVAIGHLADGETEVLLPQSYGVEIAGHGKPSPPPARGWDTASFDAALLESQGEAALELATDLREWALSPEVGLGLWFGKGATYGTERFVIADPAGYLRPIFNLATIGGAGVELGSIKHFPAYAEEEPRLDVLHALARIIGHTLKDEQAGGWPGFSMDILRDTAKLEDFKTLVGEVVSRIREG